MLILGWHGHPALKESDDSRGFAHHDAAAVLLRDGHIVAAIEEERLNRVKHSNAFPVRSMRFCLQEAGATLADVDAIVTDSSEEFSDLVAARETLSDPRAGLWRVRDLVADTFRNEFGVDVAGKLHFCRHHIAHLHAAWYPSGFPVSLALCLDGSGDGASGLVAHCGEREINVLRSLSAAQSLGDFYTAAIAYLGYSRFDEYKVMGLAPYGDPRAHESLFAKLYQLLPDGRYSLLSHQERTMLFADAGLARTARRKSGPFTQDHKNFAAALQGTLERIVDHVLAHYQRETRLRRLCLSGGVAHNCSMNGGILRSGRFDDVYVQPAAHDAGNALGAGLWLMQHLGQRPACATLTLPHLYWGTDIGSDAQIGRQLAQWGPLLEVKPVPDAAEAGAELIAGGAVIAWAQGRSEFGPRALGNRSIVADPRPAEHRQIINAMVKKREGYRPFAPSVLQERVREFFELPPGTDRVPFMVIVLPVRAHVRELLGAVTHVDGTARVQSVSCADNPRYHALIAAFGRRTGVPVVLNTSFNNNAEPIVDSVDDAVTCLLTTGIHALVIGNWVVRKTEDVAAHPAFLDLVPIVPDSRKLVRRCRGTQPPAFSLQSTVSRYFAEPEVGISETMFHVLADAKAAESVRSRAQRLLGPDRSEESLARELYSLWERRAVTLASHVGV